MEKNIAPIETKGNHLPILLLLGLFLFGYVIFLGYRPLIVPDETRYAEIQRELIESHDWMVPKINRIRYFEKPAMGFLLTSVAMLLLGENNFALRIVPTLSAGIIALLLYILASRFSPKRHLPIITVAILLTIPMFFAVGCINILDMPLTMFLTLAFTMFFLAYNETAGTKRSLYLAVLGIAAGCAFMVKGFLVFALLFFVILAFLIWEHDFKGMLSLPWIPIITAALVILPWAIMIHLREKDFWNYFFWQVHIKRFLSSANTQHPRPCWYFIGIILAGLLPWTLLVPAAWVGLQKSGTRQKFTRFILCWFLMSFLFFSMSRGKLATYIMPCFPPAALLLGIGLVHILATSEEKIFSIPVRLYFYAMAFACLALPLFQFLVFPYYLFHKNEIWKWLVLNAALLWGAVFIFLSLKNKHSTWKIMFFACSLLGAMICFHVALPDMVKQRCAPGSFLLRYKDKIKKDVPVFSDGKLFHSVCWFYKRSNIYIIYGNKMLDYGAKYKDSQNIVVSLDWFNQFVQRTSPHNYVYLIIASKNYRRWKEDLPQPVYKAVQGHFTFMQFKGGA